VMPRRGGGPRQGSDACMHCAWERVMDQRQGLLKGHQLYKDVLKEGYNSVLLLQG
jgi:hypothetical protein